MVTAPVKSVKKAFDLFSIIVFEDRSAQGLSLTDLAQRMGMPPNSARNILKSIISAGYLAQSEHGRYIPGPKSRAMIRGLVFSGQVQRSIELNIRTLSTSLNESIVFAVLVNGKRHLVALADPDRPIKVDTSHVLSPEPWRYITGRLLLAYSCEEELDETIGRYGMPGEKWNDINDIDTLRGALAGIRGRGFVTAENEHDEVFSFACPVFDEDGGFLGALGCFAPQFRTLERHITNIKTEMETNAVKLGKLISEGINQ